MASQGGLGRDLLTMADWWETLANENEATVKHFKTGMFDPFPGRVGTVARRLFWIAYQSPHAHT